MIHKNQPPKDYQFGMSPVGFLPTSNSLFVTGANFFFLTETWGNAYNPGVMGMRIYVENQEPPITPVNQYKIICTTPWFTYNSGYINGWVSTGFYYLWMKNAALVVNADCTWTLTFDALEFWGEANGGTSVLLASTGAQTMSGTLYDERLNDTGLIPSLELRAVPDTYTCETLAPDAGIWSAAVSLTGGYRYKLGTSWHVDAVDFDTSGHGSACTCSISLPPITGPDSWNVTVISDVSGSIAQGSGSVPCVHCLFPSQAYVTQTSHFQTRLESVTVKGTVPNLLSQTEVIAWNCDESGTVTSGGSTVTSTTTHTKCASHREVNVHNQFIACAVLPLVPCFDGGSCGALPTGTECEFTATADLTWPTNPPCLVTLGALDYDWSKSFRHGRISYNSGTSSLWAGVAPNGNPYLWDDYDTAISSTNAALRWQDSGNSPMGLFYLTGANSLGFAQSPDEGHTWSVPTTITSSLATGGFFDFEETWDFLRLFYWLEGSSAPYTINMAIYDRYLNLIFGPVATNLTNADLAPVRVRWFSQTGGAQYMGLEYLSGGVLLFVTARDNVNFS